MSALAPRGRGGNVARGPRGSMANTSASSRGSFRGRQANAARGGSTRGSRELSSGQGLLQQLRTGTVARNGQDAGTTVARGRNAPRGTSTTPRGQRGSSTKSFNNLSNNDSTSQLRSSSPVPSGSNDASSLSGDINQRYTHLKNSREEERNEAIRLGLLSNPEKKTTLDKAITPVGTCKEMCPPFERVERIRENMVDRCEKKTDTETGRPVPSEQIMVKRFKRPDAGQEAQIPSDIRTPNTLLRTLNYLVDNIIGGPERLAVVHKFVWDRTRSIRNDFSIQQVSKHEDVKIAVECFERIARFHIMALHQLSNPANLNEDENFDAHQEREQLNNTLLSLLFYYDDHRDQIHFPNEPEIRAYHMIMAIQPQYPDLEDRIQSWPPHIVADRRVQTALRLYQAAGDTLFYQGPLTPRAPCPVARNNSGNFWTIMNTGAVGYHLACVAEMYFNQVRLVALQCLLASAKSAPLVHQSKSREWTLSAVSEYLGFDTDQQTIDFCAAFMLSFKTDEKEVTYLDVASYPRSDLDASALPKQHTFSHTFVEEKRCRRTLQAIINNVRPANAIRQGMVEQIDEDEDVDLPDDGQSLFIPETKSAFGQHTKPSFAFGSTSLNPETSAFTPSFAFGGSTLVNSPSFGGGVSQTTTSPFNVSKKFGESADTTATSSISQQKPFSTIFGQGFGDAKESTPSHTPKFGQTSTSSSFGQGSIPAAFGSASVDEAKSNIVAQPAPNYITQFGTTRPSNTENNPFGSTSTTGQGEQSSPAAPKHITQFGTARPSNTENNPFGKTSTILQPVADSSQPTQIFGLGPNGGAPSDSTTSATPFNHISPFGTTAPQSEQPAAPTFTGPKDSAARSREPRSPFSGLNFAPPTQAQPQEQPTSATAPSQPVSSESSEKAAPFPILPTSQQPSNSPSPAETTTQPSQPSFGLSKTAHEVPKAPHQTRPAFAFEKSRHTTSSQPSFPVPSASSTSTGSWSTAAASTTPSLPPSNSSPSSAAQASAKPAFNFTPTAAKASASPPPSQTPLPAFQSSPQTQTQTRLPSLLSQDKPTPPLFTNQSPVSPHSSENKSGAWRQITPPQKVAHDKARLTEHLVRLSLTQKGGLIQEYLEFALPALLQNVVKEHQADKFRQTVTRIKVNYLFRKYGGIWRDIAWRQNLTKRANKRRQLLAESVRMEAEKKKRSEEELKMILEAVEENQRIKDQMRKRLETGGAESSRKMARDEQLAGNKRKSVEESAANTPTKHATPRVSNHKRSRTIGGMQPPPPPPKTFQTSSSQDFRQSIFSGRASLNRSRSGSNLRQPVVRAKQDETKTDYFRLLANGIDPDTPLVPLTAHRVEAKQRKDREEREAAVARAHNRRRVTSHAPRYPQSIPSAATSPSAASPLPVAGASPTPSATGSVHDPQTDELLKQLREARLALESDTTWFKEQATKMEKEVEEEEAEEAKHRTSTGSHPGSQVTGNGLSLIQGHAYSPVPPQSMSRVEARIRRTGALGLAYQPVGERSDRNSASVSRRDSVQHSLDEHQEEIEANGTAKKKRRRAAIDRSYRPSQQESLADDDELNMSPPKRTKKEAIPAVRQSLPAKASHFQPAVNRFAIPGDDDGDEEERSEEELLDDDEDDEEQQHYYHAGRQGATAEYEEDDEEDDILEDDEEEYEDDEEADDLDGGQAALGGYGDVGQYQQSSHRYNDADAPTPNTQATSRATSSAPGATAEDALVLSDSE